MRPADPDRVQGNVARRIAEIRRKRGLTQAELAEKLRVSLKYLQRIEAGTCNLTIRSLVGIGNALQTRVGELFKAPRTTRARRGRPKG